MGHLQGQHPTHGTGVGLTGFKYRKGKGGGAEFLYKCEGKWEDRSGHNPRGRDNLMFRHAVTDLLPLSVQGKLKDTPNLNRMPHDDWEGVVGHHLDQYDDQPEETLTKTEEEELRITLLKAQIKETNKRNNPVTQAQQMPNVVPVAGPQPTPPQGQWQFVPAPSGPPQQGGWGPPQGGAPG